MPHQHEQTPTEPKKRKALVRHLMSRLPLNYQKPSASVYLTPEYPVEITISNLGDHAFQVAIADQTLQLNSREEVSLKASNVLANPGFILVKIIDPKLSSRGMIHVGACDPTPKPAPVEAKATTPEPKSDKQGQAAVPVPSPKEKEPTPPIEEKDSVTQQASLETSLDTETDAEEKEQLISADSKRTTVDKEPTETEVSVETIHHKHPWTTQGDEPKSIFENPVYKATDVNDPERAFQQQRYKIKQRAERCKKFQWFTTGITCLALIEAAIFYTTPLSLCWVTSM